MHMKYNEIMKMQEKSLNQRKQVTYSYQTCLVHQNDYEKQEYVSQSKIIL